VPAAYAVDALVEHVRPALEEHGDLDAVTDLLTALRDRGTGAERQRETFRRAGRLQEVVRLAMEVTAAG
jgi:carboxylate-amine ligase